MLFARQLGPAVADRDVRTGVVAAQRRLHRRVLAADDQQPLAEIRVRVVEVVADVRQVFAGDVEPARVVGPAGDEDEPAGRGSPRRAARRAGRQQERRRRGDRGRSMPRPARRCSLQVELARRPRGGRPGIPRGCTCRLVRRLQRDAGDRDPLVGAEEARLRREPRDRVADLFRVEVEVVDPRALRARPPAQARSAPRRRPRRPSARPPRRP